jgi:L-aspartate oxidase
MTDKIEPTRYLINIDSVSTQQFFTDTLIIGAGVAGLRAAIEAASCSRVTILCKGSLKDSNTWKAQGGIASVLDKSDTFESHISDTLKTGCGLCDRQTVELVVRHGPELIEQLLQWGAKFDKVNNAMSLTLEGGHSHPRIAHAHGDETGRGIAETLIKKVRENPNIKVFEKFYVIDLLTSDENKCLGVIGYNSKKSIQIIWADNTVLATGGVGRLYRETTNPEVATADGIAMTYRTGAVLQDLEFIQFHPTTLYIAGATRALITETIRGEGAKLVDNKGNAFMKGYHASAELAPRDVVSRAIFEQMLKTESTHVFLDMRHFDKTYFAKRFPYINELLESFDIDISCDLVPVRPSAHYMVGGVKTDYNAATSIRNLYACGEIAATGLHGANRLGSNSLLEGLVFGQIAGRQICKSVNANNNSSKRTHIKFDIPQSNRTHLNTEDVLNSLRSLMERNVGITRSDQPLAEAQEIIRFWQRYVMDKVFDSPEGWQCQNMLTVCLLMAQAAQQRCESRGVHYRTDYPQIDDKNFNKHIEISKSQDENN